MIRRILTALAVTAVSLGIAATAAAQWTPPPLPPLPAIGHVIIEAQATKFLDSLAHDARTKHVENGACILNYAVQDSVLHISKIGPADYDMADSMHLSWDTTNVSRRRPICPDGVPALHSHMTLYWTDARTQEKVFWVGEAPSDTDLDTAWTVKIWQALLIVYDNGYRLLVYP